MDIAVLGMGRMGRALAARLLEGGHSVRVWNRSKGKADEIVSAGGREAHSVADAVDGADVAITMLANDDAVRDVALGELRWSIGEKTVYVDCSTVSPALSGKLTEAFPARFLALPESFAVGRCGGLTDDQLRELLGSSPQVAPGLKNRFESILTGSQDGWWTTVLGAKDAGLAIDIARGADVELPVATVVQQRYEKAAASGLHNADIAAV